MARPKRLLPVGWPVHVINRGNDRRRIFADRSDLDAFCAFLADASRRFAVDLDAYCALHNHVHLLLRQRQPGAVSAYIHRVLSLSAMRYREGTGTVGHGHVFQRRYWSKVVTDERQYVATARYVEANARRAGLVEKAEHWEWGSLWERVTGGRALLAAPLVSLPADWAHVVNQEQPPSELASIRQSGRARSGATQSGGPGP